MKVLLFLMFAFLATVFTVPPFQGYSYRFTSVKCSASLINTTKNHFCFVKNFNRNVSTMNYGFFLNRPLNQMFIKFSIDYKYGSVFRPIMNPPVFEWCSVISTNSSQLVLKVVIDMIEESVPKLIHKCPYQVIKQTNTFIKSFNNLNSRIK